MIVVLTGPTASGKSGMALSLATSGPLADRLEIISMDSAQVYRGMDIGTAKPSPDERAAVPHHLIDLIDPWQAYSAARFRDDALSALADIRQRGRIPLVVGGTLLYGRALLVAFRSFLKPKQQSVKRLLTKLRHSGGQPCMQHSPESTHKPPPVSCRMMRSASLEHWKCFA
ncbi:MAG: hypothetical protein RL585_2077 [Pseudomonadota bacterium]